MVQVLYVEQSCWDHPRVMHIRQHFKGAHVIPCHHYGEIFNRRAQSFRQQKNNPALILAEKSGNLVLPCPDGFGIGGVQNYYFSHMLNCIYDCRYCFLQGMYPSAHRVLFVNYENFMEDIDKVIASHSVDRCFFFSGYDADSLAFDPISRFVDAFIPFFRARPQATLELRSKSTNIRSLLVQPPCDNVVVAFSLLPEKIASKVDCLTPVYRKRLHAIKLISNSGWPIGLRFDPMILSDDYETVYPSMVNQLFTQISPDSVHSVSIGPMRFPLQNYKKIKELYPNDALLAHPLERRDRVMSYSSEIEKKLFITLKNSLVKYLPEDVIFSCYNDVASTK